MKAVVLDGYTLNPGDLSWDGLSDLFEDWEYYDRTPSDEILSRCSSAHLVLTNKVPFSKATMEQLPELKCILVMATGYNVVDTDAAADLGIAIYNVPSYSTEEVAQHVFAMILHITNRVSETNQDVKSGGWERSKDFSYSLYSIRALSGLTLGLIGYGAIARQVADIALAFKMKVIVFNRSEINDSRVLQVDRETLCSSSDFISLHIPENDETRNLVDFKFLSACTSHSWIINTARGGLINEITLLKAAQQGIIAGAFLDVLVKEPMAIDHPFKKEKNILITPHVAWAADRARIRCMETLVRNAQAFLEGNNENRVA